MNKHNREVILRSEIRTSPCGLVVTRWNYVQHGLYAGWEFDEVLHMQKPKPNASREAKVVRGRPVETVPKVSVATTVARAKAIIKRRNELEKQAAHVPSAQPTTLFIREQGIRKVQRVALLKNPEYQLNRKAAKQLAARKKDWAMIYTGPKAPPMGAYHCPGSLQ